MVQDVGSNIRKNLQRLAYSSMMRLTKTRQLNIVHGKRVLVVHVITKAKSEVMMSSSPRFNTVSSDDQWGAKVLGVLLQVKTELSSNESSLVARCSSCISEETRNQEDLGGLAKRQVPER